MVLIKITNSCLVDVPMGSKILDFCLLSVSSKFIFIYIFYEFVLLSIFACGKTPKCTRNTNWENSHCAQNSFGHPRAFAALAGLKRKNLARRAPYKEITLQHPIMPFMFIPAKYSGRALIVFVCLLKVKFITKDFLK